MRNRRAYAPTAWVIFLLLFTGRAKAYSLGFDGGLNSIQYHEILPAGAKSTQSGTLYSVQMFSEQMTGPLEWRERLNLALNNLEYNGTDLNTGAPLSAVNEHTFITAEATLAVPLFWGIHLYAGLEGRQWYRFIPGYEEIYTLFYVPIGLRLASGGTTGLSIALDVSARPLVHGSLAPTFKNLGYDNRTLPVTYALGYAAEIPVTLHLSKDTQLILTPWYQVLKIGQGPVEPLTINGQPALSNGKVLGAYEPASITTEYGARLGLSFGI